MLLPIRKAAIFTAAGTTTTSNHLLLRLLSTTTTSNPTTPKPPKDTLNLTLNPTTISDPIATVSSLWIRSFSRPHPFSDLTGFFKKPHLWALAYRRASAHFTGSFPTVIPPSLPSLQLSVLSSSFRWADHQAQILQSPTIPAKTRPFDASKPLFQDRVVQELLLLLLEPIFESKFSPRSHGFRPGRNPHTALRSVRSGFAGYLWFVKADLSTITDGLQWAKLHSCLQKGVRDQKVLSLLGSAVKMPRKGADMDDGSKYKGDARLRSKRMKRKMVRLGRRRVVLKEGEPKPDPYWLSVFDAFAPEEASNIPDFGHCGILSPLIANVYLHELDIWLEGRMEEYFRPTALDSIWKESMDDGCHNPSWPEFVPSCGREKTRKMDFIRYGMHVLIGIRGPREDALQIRKELMEFCESQYGVKLENSNVEIEHISRGIEFLDHVICRRVIYPTLRYTGTGGKIVREKGVGTLLSVTASLPICIARFRKLELLKGDRDPDPLPCFAMFYAGQAHTNSQMNKFLETMADWYRYADNRKKIVAFCAYVVRSSLAKLYAARYRLKSRAKVYGIATRDLSRPIMENTRKDAPEYADLLRLGLVDAIDGVQFSQMSQIPSCDYTPLPRNWIPDHERVLREYIRLQDPKFFCELYKSVKQRDSNIPQDGLSQIIWDCKTHGIRSSQFRSNMKRMGTLITEGPRVIKSATS